jgi:hypothetical protein
VGDHCDGKHGYATQAEADAKVAEMQAQRYEPRRRSKRLHSYRCPNQECGLWHVGHLDKNIFKSKNRKKVTE